MHWNGTAEKLNSTEYHLLLDSCYLNNICFPPDYEETYIFEEKAFVESLIGNVNDAISSLKLWISIC